MHLHQSYNVGVPYRHCPPIRFTPAVKVSDTFRNGSPSPPLTRANIFKGRRRHAKRKKAEHDAQYARAKGEKMSRYAEQDMHAPPCALFTYVHTLYMPRQSCMTNVFA